MRLLNKLKSYGIFGQMFDLIAETIKNRRQIVKFNECFSEEILVKSGVLQGGVLSPTLFNIYISYIIRNIESNIFQFADDLSLIKVIYTESDCNSLQNDLNIVFNYCEENSLKINPIKCEFLRIGFKNYVNFDYKLNNISINNVQNHKHIGIIYDTKMCFNSQIDCIIEKSLKKFSLLKVICNRVNGLTFLRLYKTYILPILEFINLSIVLTQTQCLRLESIQRKITKYICYKLSKSHLSYEERLKQLEINSLEKRRKIQILIIVFKIRFKLKGYQNKWQNEFEFYETTRNGVFCKTYLHKTICDKNIFIYASNLFNSLPKNIKSDNNYRNFVNNLQSFL